MKHHSMQRVEQLLAVNSLTLMGEFIITGYQLLDYGSERKNDKTDYSLP